ncbi:C40 family peptidase [Desulfovirgula thermocuniculi]|uniref:C40 family peptidase n=1 Tax=Desulfovirgula thermocuniculi TaxID=348842 RepID=UPI0004064262|nr:LysM peptidoglycan-binding domain-containing C40 family peptidase [Desulfovirgula thermocuniculi]
MSKLARLAYAACLAFALWGFLPGASWADVTYTVVPGDTLYRISRMYGTTVRAIQEANNIWTHLIYPGQVLVIPVNDAPQVDNSPSQQPPPQVSRGSLPDARLVLAKAASLLGSPYAYGGSGPYTFDCSGFTRYVFGQVGIDLPHNAAAQAGLGIPVSMDQLAPGDLVFFSYYGRPGIEHVGIYVGDGQFIHASSRAGVKYSSLYEPYYAANYKGARRILR